MIELIVQRGVHCFGLPVSLRDRLKKELTYENPQYKNAKKHGKWVSVNTRPYLKFYAENEECLYIPRGHLWNLKRRLRKANIKHKLEDRTLRFKPIKFEFTGTPRDYQAEAIDDIVRYPIGVLEANTGSGKTFMALNMIQKRGQPTLIIVHTKELFYQWQESIKKFMNYDCGLVGDSKFVVRDITVGLIKSVNNKLDQLRDEFGHLIIDECHRCPAKVWSHTLTNFSAKYFLGLSATTYRRDSLSGAIFSHIGPKIHQVDKEHLFDIGAVLRPEIIRVNTHFQYKFRNDYSTMLSALTRNEQRNKLVVSAIIHDYKKHNNPILVVSDRVGHCKQLAKLIKDAGYKVNVLVSSVSKKKRKEIVQDMKDGTVNITVSTLSLIGEGFDAPNLHALFLATPVKFSGRVLQVVGRILRPEENKTPRVYDFRDTMVKPLLYSGFERDRTYRKQWG